MVCPTILVLDNNEVVRFIDDQIYNQGPKDGTVIGVPLNGIPP